jgi:hypothetical protein
VFLELLLALIMVGLLIQLLRQRQRLERLERSLAAMEKHLRAQSVWIETLDQRFGLAPPPDRAPPRRPANPTPTPPTHQPQLPTAPRPQHVQPPAPPQVATPPQRPAAWRTVERLFSEHWSGILGVVVLVAGVTFLAINVALRLGPLQRFWVVTAVALALALPSALVGRRPPWRNLTTWMRSGGAALLLFACTAAGAFPQLGLQWIHTPGAALALLALGVVPNLALAAIVRTQTIASLHVVVNLVPLAIAPQTPLGLALATAVALVGAQLPMDRPWNRHRLIVTWAYAPFLAHWVLQNGGPWASAPASAWSVPWLPGLATLAAALVFGGGALRHQRAALVPARLEGMPLALQLSDWGALGFALLVIPPQASVRAGALALAALALLGLGWRAKRLAVPWLQHSNVLVAQAFALTAIASLPGLLANGPLLLFLLLVECALFLLLGLREGDGPILRVGWALTAVAGLLLILVVLPAEPTTLSLTDRTSPMGLLLGGTVLTTAVQALLRRRGAVVPLPPLLGWLVGAQAFTATVLTAAETSRPLMALGLLGSLVLVARRLQPAGLLAGTAVAIGLLQPIDWIWLLARHPLAVPTLALHLAALALLALALIRWAPAGPVRLLGLDGLGLTAGLGAFLLLDPIAPQLPSVGWLMLSLLALEAANRSGRAAATHWLVVAIGYGVAFAGSWLLVVHPSPAVLSLGWFSLTGRPWITLCAIAVALRWTFFPASRRLASLPLWQRIQPCCLELALAGAILLIPTELTRRWQPLAWSLLALVPLAPPLRRRFPIRLQLYSVVVYWVGVASVVTMLSTLSSPSPQWWVQPTTLGLLAIGVQTLYVVTAHRWLALEPLRQPGGLPILSWLGNRIADRPNPWLYYPMFTAVAVYIGVRYDRSLLTLLWSAQAMAIYGLSALLRERPFRHLALLGLGACLLRLLAVDMAQADLGLRGLVFIGVGLLMLAMNALANRFRSRFE